MLDRKKLIGGCIKGWFTLSGQDAIEMLWTQGVCNTPKCGANMKLKKEKKKKVWPLILVIKHTFFFFIIASHTINFPLKYKVQKISMTICMWVIVGKNDL